MQKKIDKIEKLFLEAVAILKEIEYNDRHQMRFNYDPSPKSTTSPQGTDNQ